MFLEWPRRGEHIGCWKFGTSKWRHLGKHFPTDTHNCCSYLRVSSLYEMFHAWQLYFHAWKWHFLNFMHDIDMHMHENEKLAPLKFYLWELHAWKSVQHTFWRTFLGQKSHHRDIFIFMHGKSMNFIECHFHAWKWYFHAWNVSPLCRMVF